MQRVTLILGLTSALLLGAAESPSAAPNGANQCFNSRDYQAYRPVDDKAFNIRVNANEYYRIDLVQSCPALAYPTASLIMTLHGSDQICGPLDWDLRVGQVGSIGDVTQACIVDRQTKLTPEQAAALPKHEKP